MNKKGFTLVELLAAIIILSLLALLASTSVTNVVRNSKSDLYDSQIALIKSAAELWGADNLSMLPNVGECKYLTLRDLKGYGSLESSIINPKTNEEFSDDMIIKISSEETEYGTLSINYEVDSNNVNGCRQLYKTICTAVTEETVTTGNIPKGRFATGDEYICEVKNGVKYHFFVLSGQAGSINLIMDSNIDLSGNPVKTNENVKDVSISEAISNLNEATKDWEYIDNLNETYGSVLLTGKARLPKISEVTKVESGCGFDTAYGSCKKWLVNYLQNEESTYVGLISVNTLGYWIFEDNGSISRRVIGDAMIFSMSSSVAGIRPVISVPISEFTHLNVMDGT